MTEPRRALALPFPGVPLADHAPLFRLAERLGYDDLWTGDNYGADGFTPLVLAAAHTHRIRLATGIISTFTRGPLVLAQHAAALADASRGRFVLGLGSSSDVIVEKWNGVPFERPIARMRATVEGLRAALAGDRGPGGFRLDRPPEYPVPIIVAALRGRMLALAGEIGDGVMLHAVPVSGMTQVTEVFAAPGKEIVARLHVVPGPRDRSMPLAKRAFLIYATVPVYAEYFRWLGWSAALDPAVAAWAAGDRRRALELCPEDLVEEIYVLGTPTEIEARLAAFAAAGVTTLVLGGLDSAGGTAEFIENFAPGRARSDAAL